MNKHSQYGMLSIILMILTSWCVTGATIHADENTHGMDFGVTMVKQQNQKSQKTYFDLNMNENQHQILPVLISNPNDYEIKVKVTVVDATTTSIGEIQYLEQNTYKSAKGTRLTDLVREPEQTLTVPKYSTVTAKIDVTTPKKMKGIILGGIKVEKLHPSEVSALTDENSINIKNLYSYVIGAQLNFGNPPEKQFDFSIGKIKLTTVNYRKKLIVPINNDMHQIMSKVNTNVNVYKANDNSKKLVTSTQIEKAAFAPMSTMGVQLDPKNITQGNYIAEITLQKDGVKKQLVKKFYISAQDEQAAQKNSVQDNHLNWWAIGSAALLSALSLLYIIWKVKHKRH